MGEGRVRVIKYQKGECAARGACPEPVERGAAPSQIPSPSPIDNENISPMNHVGEGARG